MCGCGKGVWGRREATGDKGAEGREGNSGDKASYQAVSHRHQQCGAGMATPRAPQAVTNHTRRPRPQAMICGRMAGQT
ncbi:hypothetical protein E2C01_078302 [Portunus trituberculatus]|uniref:Uncharacterized protein n=1 Tax=Portunus trituberculatus TaxID=210409 RepID=A0A5B7IGM5_PORTR|nr:hypothetical protein [Portunus trituberculatus]